MFDHLHHRLAAYGPWPRRVLALACLALAAVTALPRGGPVPAAPTVPVQVAARALPAAHVLRAADLQVRRLPRGALPRSQLLPATRLVGQRLAGPVAAGEPIGALRLVGRTLTASLPRGSVAVGVTTDDAHVAEFVHPGDRVDVLGATAPPDEDTAGRSTTAQRAPTVAAGVRVLAVLPDGDADQPGTEVVLAAPRPVAARLAAIRGNGPVTVLAASP